MSTFRCECMQNLNQKIQMTEVRNSNGSHGSENGTPINIKKKRINAGMIHKYILYLRFLLGLLRALLTNSTTQAENSSTTIDVIV